MKVGLATIHNVDVRPFRGASYIYKALSESVEVRHLAPEFARRAATGRPAERPCRCLLPATTSIAPVSSAATIGNASFR